MTKKISMALRVEALAHHLDIPQSMLTTNSWGGIETENQEWRVLTRKEADKAAREYIKESLWAFNPAFLADYLPRGMTIEAIQKLQELYEDANEPLALLVGSRLSALAADAIKADGRGHFLAGYDGEEITLARHPEPSERPHFFGYRLN